jgi:DNA-binding MarR family transcriptional regulator
VHSPQPDRTATRDPEAAAEVWALIQEFTDRHSPRHELRRRLGDGLAKGRGKVKALLQLADGPCSLGDIADAQRIDRPYATIIVDQLESLGLVERAADPEDRRRKVVALTAAGRTAAGTAAAIMAEPPAALTGLHAAELEQLRTLLGRLLPQA